MCKDGKCGHFTPSGPSAIEWGIIASLVGAAVVALAVLFYPVLCKISMLN